MSSRCCMAYAATCNKSWYAKATVFGCTSRSAQSGIRTSCGDWPSAPPTCSSSQEICFGSKASPRIADDRRFIESPSEMPAADLYRTALKGFASLVEPTNEDASIDLAGAALAIARTEYPTLDIPYYLARLEALAQRVRDRMRSTPTARETIALLNRVLFDEEGLRGNRDDYYDPRNSFLNDVLDRKLGIPITLSVIYLDVARRVGFPIAGTGMPGHFLLKHYDVNCGEILIDAFNRGRVVGNTDCQQRLK